MAQAYLAGRPGGGYVVGGVTAPQDPVLMVLERELARSMDGLSVPGTPRPYAMQYTVRRQHELRLRAVYGSLTRAQPDTSTRLFADVRVGNHAFDSVIDGGLDVVAEDRESADWLSGPQDLDPVALQVALWKLTQVKFDEAVKDYYDHRKTLVTEYLRDAQDAFSRERAVVLREPLHHEPFPQPQWEANLRAASRRFLDHPDIYDPSISLVAERIHRWLVTSDGTRVVTEEVFVEVDVAGWILSDDGVYTEAARQLHARRLQDAPDAAAIEAAVLAVIEELRELQTAESPGSFVGPVLLGGQAASTLIHEALGHRLEGERLVARGETRTFARKLGEQILPGGLSIVDDPRRTNGDAPVWGGYAVDDEGVMAQPAELVRDGVLVGFLRSRTPATGESQSNGHGRHDGIQPTMARMAHTIVEADPKRTRLRPELEAQLLERARREGRRYVLIIESIRAGETSTSSYDFQAFKGEPDHVIRVDVETGERRRVRDVELIGTPLSALQRIVAFGGTPAPDAGFCYAESGAVPVSGIAPDLLLSELELQQASTSGFHEPLLPPPFADDGSRGRAKAGVRERGRRRRH